MSTISHNFKAASLHPSFSKFNLKFSLPNATPSLKLSKAFQVKCIKKTKRTGKLRYPSERKKLKLQQNNEIDVKNKFEGIWRLFKLGVSAHEDPGKDFWGVSEPLLREIAKVLEFPVASMLPPEAFKVVRKSFDARKKGPKFVYTVDMDVGKLLNLEPRTWEFISELKPKTGSIERAPHQRFSGDLITIIRNYTKRNETAFSTDVFGRNNFVKSSKIHNTRKPKVAVVGSGPSGLFASLVLAEFGGDVTLIERGQAVEQRGRDIGALVVRRMLQLESNFCFGEVIP